jgi:hypothetical protein
MLEDDGTCDLCEDGVVQFQAKKVNNNEWQNKKTFTLPDPILP